MNLGHFLDQGYKLTGVIHVGAHEGQEVPEYRDHGLNIICFEPLTIAAENFKIKYPDVKLYKLALGNKNAPAKLNVSNDGAFGQSSSLLGFLPENIGMTGGLKRVQLTHEVRFENFVHSKRLKLEYYDTVVIDVQGSELAVLKGFGKLLTQLKYFIVECSEIPLYKDGATAHEVVDYMADNGFVRNSPIERHNDIAFIRKDLHA